MLVPPLKAFSGGTPHRRGIRRPRQGDVRMMISVPALVVLLVVGMGVANYLVNRAYVEKTQNNVERITKMAEETRKAAPQTAPRLSPLTETAAEIHRSALAILNSSLVLLVIFPLVALVSSVGLVWTVLRPIRRLADAAATIIRGDIRPDLDFKGGAFEIDQLGRTFNSMVDFINSMIEQREVYLSEGVQTGCMIVNTRGRVTTLNAAGQAILGVDREKLVGKTLPEIRKENPELFPSLLAWCEKALEHPNAGAEETELPGDAGCPPLLAASTLLRDERNIPSAIFINFLDTSKRRDLRDLFSGTDQLAALGTFTYGLTHELRNPLGALKGAAQLLGEMVADRGDCAPYVNHIVHEVNRLDRLIRELYSFSHAPISQPEICDPNEIARRGLMWARQELTQNLQEGKTVREEYGKGLPKIVVQPDRVVRAIANVIINAFESMPKGGALLIRTGVQPASESESGQEGSSPVRPVVLDIVNTGSTIPEENLQRIFDPFFSTKQGGSGLGLAIAYQIVSQNRGRLEVFVKDETVRLQFVFRVVRPA